jgi:transcription termination/antitermination protein NusG
MSSNIILSADVAPKPPIPDQPTWYAIYTAPNQEKLVSQRLRDRGIEHFLPLYRTVRKRTDRRVVLDLPLFPGYLFVRIPLLNRIRVLEIPRVVRMIGHSSVPSALPDSEIESLRMGLSGDTTAQPSEFLKKGCRVRVVRGPFAGSDGILVRRKHGFRVVIAIELIRQAFAVEVGEEDLERIH